MSLVLGALAAWLAAIALYLLALTVLALRWRSAMLPPPGERLRRFAICVPAHDEESRLPRLLASLSAQDYPHQRFAVHVIADNCTDATAAVAVAGGATTHTRVDASLHGKGFALAWLLTRLRESGERYDAYVVVDADSTLEANFLARMDARLAAGADAIQAYYAVLDPEASGLSSLRSAALAAIHYVRPLGRSILGLSAGLKGNGMCFSAELLERLGWHWFTLAEDVEFHLAIVASGSTVVFAPETCVLGAMPGSFGRATSQNARWERGRLQMIKDRVPLLILEGLRHRDGVRLDAAIEQLIPPLSVPLGVSVIVAMSAGLLGHVAIAGTALLSAAAYAAHVITGMILTRAPSGAYTALALVPAYVVWKIGLYLRALLPTRDKRWVRTSRL